MAGRQGKGNQQVRTLFPLGHDGVVANRRGRSTTAAGVNLALTGDHTIFDEPTNLVDVGAARGEADQLRRDKSAKLCCSVITRSLIIRRPSRT
jgi:hypothetical protein